MQKYNGQLIRQFASSVSGNAASGVTVTVRRKSDNALATLYVDNNTAGATLSNPITTTDKGFFAFYAADGVYTLTFSDNTPQQVIQLQDVAALQDQFDSAVLNAGYIPSGTFAAGATLTQANQVLSDGSSYWRWDGSFPKTVTAGSAPTPTGVGGWVVLSDFALRNELASTSSSVLVGGVSAAILGSRGNKWAVVTDPSFGADNTGAVFATDAFMAAQANSNFIIVPPGIYAMDPSKKVRIFSGKTWFFMGATFTKPAGAGTMFAAEFETDFNLLGAATFVGNATQSDVQNNTGFTGETGLRIESCARYKVGDFKFKGLAGYGLKMTGSAGASPYFGERGRFASISASLCHFGIDIDAGNGSEYNTFVNYDLSNNRVGLRLGAGNNTFSGGSITGNRYANVQLTGGQNNGHGVMSSTTINHAGVYNLLAQDVTVGFTFAGCHWFGNAANSSSGQIFIQNSDGIVLDGGTLDCWVNVWGGSLSGYHKICNMWCSGGYGKVKIYDDLNLRPTNMLVSGCFGAGARDAVTGDCINSPDVYVSLGRGPNGGQILTLGTYTVLQFPSNLVLRDDRRAWNSSTNLFTVPAQMGGIYKISFRATFQTTGTIDIKTSRLRILKNGSTTGITYRAYSKGAAADNTDIISIDVNEQVLLVDGDTLQFEAKIDGTGTQVFSDPDSRMVLEIIKI